jgi:hypothetical protein
MTLLLMGLALAMFGFAVTAAAFGTATRPPAKKDSPVQPRPDLAPERFFARSHRAFHQQPQVPIEVLLAQIEQHVRLEQAAAESFIHVPSPESLNCRTESPLVH